MERVKAKKFLGQHFLKNEDVAEAIANQLNPKVQNVLEIGPGMGVLTKYIVPKNFNFKVVELDRESVQYLKEHYPALEIISGDFLKLNLNEVFSSEFSLIGNFPYNISTQILFSVLEYKELIPEMTGMFQKEVAERVAAGPGSKTYGILSVLVQAFYECTYLFTVQENDFIPPPKVKSAVIKLVRKSDFKLDCDEKLFFTVVKTAFNQRRKTLRNTLKPFGLEKEITTDSMFDKRPEQLGVFDFIALTNLVAKHKK